MKVGGGAKWNASLEQGAQVSMPTQREATTTRHHHTEKLSGDTSLLTEASQEGGKEKCKLPNKCTILELEIERPPRASTRHPKLGENPYVE